MRKSLGDGRRRSINVEERTLADQTSTDNAIAEISAINQAMLPISM
jgi:hypothetical protein